MDDPLCVTMTVLVAKSLPSEPALLSSRREDFFVRSSNSGLISVTKVRFILCFTGESLPLYDTYYIELPF